jgi:hypothetical protein
MLAVVPEGPIALPQRSPAIPGSFRRVFSACRCCHRPTTRALFELRVAFVAEADAVP